MRGIQFTKRLIIATLISVTGTTVLYAASQATPVEFKNSCGKVTESTFNDAVTFLHTFEYPESEKAFRRTLGANPKCAMARWGIAMSLWHPLWAPPSQATLKKGLAILEDIEKLQVTVREAAYIGAIKEFYKDYEKTSHAYRAKEYEKKMNEVYKDHLDDPEATIFYALAILGTIDPKDKSYLLQYKSASLLNWVRASYPYHPGVLHYIIHSYDFPGLAHLALDVARIFAKAAPNSTHAQHMPSHIFTRLGFWNESISSNHDSTASAAEYTKRAHLPGHYDQGLHSTDYLMYAFLQTSRDEEARLLLEKLRGIGVTDTEDLTVAVTLASVPSRYVLERKQWKDASELELLRSKDFAWKDFAWAKSIHHFARGIGAARSQQIGKAKVELQDLENIKSSLQENTLVYWREEVSVQIDAVSSWIHLKEGNTKKALQLAEAAADREDAVDKHPATPGEVLPARELFADMLLEVGRFDEALKNYQIDLTHSPNRYNGLLGAARASAKLGQSELARSYYKKMLSQVKTDGSNRPSDDEARKHLAAKG